MMLLKSTLERIIWNIFVMKGRRERSFSRSFWHFSNKHYARLIPEVVTSSRVLKNATMTHKLDQCFLDAVKCSPYFDDHS